MKLWLKLCLNFKPKDPISSPKWRIYGKCHLRKPGLREGRQDFPTDDALNEEKTKVVESDIERY